MNRIDSNKSTQPIRAPEETGTQPRTSETAVPSIKKTNGKLAIPQISAGIDTGPSIPPPRRNQPHRSPNQGRYQIPSRIR